MSSVCPSVSNDSRTAELIFVKIDIGWFSKNSSNTCINRTTTDTLREERVHFSAHYQA
jgi:hypothetical protein